jgi:aromatic ring hydroxylase
MAIPTGEQLLQSLRDGRLLFIDGDRVEDVTTDRRFAAAARRLLSSTTCSTTRR